MSLSSFLTLDRRLFGSTFALVAVAEIPDKTAFAAAMLGVGRRPVAAFVGVAAAFVIQSIVAIACGSAISCFPHGGVRLLSGLLFLCFAIAMWLRTTPAAADEPAAATATGGFWRTAGAAFLVIFVAEWGDLTQLATAALAAKHPKPWTIFCAATLALWLVAGAAIALGHHLQRTLPPQLVQRIAALAFLVIGLLILADVSLGTA